MAALFPKLAVEHDGSLNLNVAVALMHLMPVLEQGVFKLHALGKEEREAGALVHQRKEAELLADLSMVALLGFLEHGDISIKIGLLFKSGRIDALEHLILLAAAPVCARNAHYLDILALAGRFKMRTRAEIHKIALLVEADDLALGQILDKLNLIGLGLLLHKGDGLIAGQLKPFKGQVFSHYLFHFLLDLREILGGEGDIGIEIVVEAVFDGGADSELDLGPQPLYGLRQNMRARVAIGPSAALVGEGEELQRMVAVDGQRRVVKLAVQLSGKGRFSKARADALGDGVGVHAVFKLTNGTVGEGDVDHFLFSFSFGLYFLILGGFLFSLARAVFGKNKNRLELDSFKDGIENKTAVPP